MRKIFVLLLAISSIATIAQNSSAKQQYVEQFKDIAIEEMHKYKIPASITLAQGILESSSGTSRLARQANNHFGIKCGTSWTGATISHDDDSKNECFRRYRSAEESYVDHSKFLASSKRYASLFSLKTTDYTGWAKGLLAAGYATNPQYANLLIKMIEDNDLHQYDFSKPKDHSNKRQEPLVEVERSVYRKIGVNNGVKYVIAQRNDSFATIALEQGIKTGKILEYNDLETAIPLNDGDAVYVQQKKKRSTMAALHVVVLGDTTHSLAQRYGIRLKQFVKLNPKLNRRQPEIGETLRLR